MPTTGHCPLAFPPLGGRVSFGEEVWVCENLVASGFLIPQGETLLGSEHRRVLTLHPPVSFLRTGMMSDSLL